VETSCPLAFFKGKELCAHQPAGFQRVKSKEIHELYLSLGFERNTLGKTCRVQEKQAGAKQRRVKKYMNQNRASLSLFCCTGSWQKGGV